MKKYLAAAVAFAFASTLAGSAMACAFKSAHKHSNVLADSSTTDKKQTGEAMSTFDPKLLEGEKLAVPETAEDGE